MTQRGKICLTSWCEHFTDALRTELQDRDTLDEIQSLLTDFLEETKLTILQRLEAQDREDAAAEVEHLRQVSFKSNRPSSIEVLPGLPDKRAPN